MKASAEGSRQCCDAQLADAGGNRAVVAARLGQGASNRSLMPPGQVKATFGVMPKQALADAGCRNEAELARLEASRTWRAWRRTSGGWRPVGGPPAGGSGRKSPPEGSMRWAMGAIPSPRAHAWRETRRSGRRSENPRRPSPRLPARELPRRRFLARIVQVLRRERRKCAVDRTVSRRRRTRGANLVVYGVCYGA